MTDDSGMLIYLAILIGIWFFSLFKSIIIQIMTGTANNEFFCPELLIAIIITQIFMPLANSESDKLGPYLKYSLFNIVFTLIAWGFGTASGGRALFGHPSHMIIKIIMSFIC